MAITGKRRAIVFGALGIVALVVLALMALVPNYEYAPRARATEISLRAMPIREQVERRILERNSVDASGLGLTATIPTNAADVIARAEILRNGTMVLVGSREPIQSIRLVPTLSAGKVTWQCLLGTSEKSPPAHCTTAP